MAPPHPLALCTSGSLLLMKKQVHLHIQLSALQLPQSLAALGGEQPTA